VLEDANLTPILHALVTESSLPLKGLESKFAVDSTGLSTSRYARWLHARTGTVKEKADFVKLHGLCGTLTNVIVGVELGIGSDNDSPMLRPLVEGAAERFRIEQMSGDKAYSSYENHEVIG